MLNRLVVQSVLFLFLLAFPLFCFAADYKIVIKKNGKIIEGKLVAEDDSSVTIISQGTRLSYKKETLDLERMKKLNANYFGPSDVRTLDIPSASDQQPVQQETSLADVAKQARDSNEPGTARVSDANERSLVKYIAELEERVRVQATQASQMQLSKAKKALQYYRNRESRELSDVDRRLMLEQLVEALDLEYTTQLEAGAPDETTAILKKRREDAKEKLSQLD